VTLVAPLLDELELFGVEQLLDFRLRLALGGPLLEPLGHLVCISKAGNSTSYLRLHEWLGQPHASGVAQRHRVPIFEW
jgi:hypothetical protein